MVKRRLAGGVILCLALTAPLATATPTSVVIGTPPQPSWGQLDLRQKTALSPLAADWDGMDNIRRKKWLGIAERYPSMGPDEQRRVQERMREWARLTPEQRSKVRDTYKDFNQLPAEQKQTVRQKWEIYSTLSDEEKQRLRSTGKSSQLLAPPPAPAEIAPAMQDSSVGTDGNTGDPTRR